MRLRHFAAFTLLCASVVAGTSCAQTLGQRNIIENNGFRLKVEWCAVNPDRSAECELTATSLTQDYKAGFAYPILQDQSGAQYRMVPKAGGLGQYVMIAGAPYTIRYVNKDVLPTTVARVRGLTGSWAFWTLKGIKAGGFPVVFSDIPAGQGQARQAAKSDPGPAATERAVPEWETVAFWTYDATDGRHLAEGLVLKPAPGGVGAYAWTHRLELTAHARLQPRADRILWPVFLNRRQKRVCVDAPYPTYSGYIDLPGATFDGVYAFASCKGGQG